MKVIVETSRLLLREFLLADSENLYLLNSDPDVIRYTGDDAFQSEEDARRFLERYDKYRRYGYGRWTVILKETNEYAGWCGLSYMTESMETDLGFRLLKRFWNKGIATEAAKASIAYGFETLGLKKIVGRAMVENMASRRVLEKTGMQFEKYFQAHESDCLQYFILTNV